MLAPLAFKENILFYHPLFNPSTKDAGAVDTFDKNTLPLPLQLPYAEITNSILQEITS